MKVKILIYPSYPILFYPALMANIPVLGVYAFWYCDRHDDGAIVLYPDTDLQNNIQNNKNKIYKCPNWLNICYECDILKKNNCIYSIKGIIEYTNNNIIETYPVQISYERENGGFELKHYLHNIYEINNYNKNKPEIILHDYNNTDADADADADSNNTTNPFINWILSRSN